MVHDDSFRRLLRARDAIHARYAEPLDLRALAREAAVALPLPPPFPRRLRGDAAPVPDAGAARGSAAPAPRRCAGDPRLLRGRVPEPGFVQRALRSQDRHGAHRLPPAHPPLFFWPAAPLHPALLRAGIFAILKKRARRRAATRSP